MDKVKGFAIKFIVLAINAALVAGGVFFIKNQQQHKQAQVDLVATNEAQQAAQGIATQAQQLQQIVEQNRNQKTGSISGNPANITVQQPTTVTQTTPAKTTTVTVPASTSTSTPTPTTTTKKS